MRNWPYAIRKTADEATFNRTMNVGWGVVPLPGVTAGKTAATLGG